MGRAAPWGSLAGASAGSARDCKSARLDRYPFGCTVRYATISLVLLGGRRGHQSSWVTRVSSTELYRVVSALAFRMEYTQAPDELLTSVAELIGRELSLPYVLIEIEHTAWRDNSAEFGKPVGKLLALPLTYQGYPAGRLVVSGRGPGRGVSRRDRRGVVAVGQHTRAARPTPPLRGGPRQSPAPGALAAEEGG